MFDLTLFWEYRSILWQGMLVNILVFFLASSVGMAIGLIACVGRLSPLAGLRAASAGYIEITRSIPEFVLLIWVHSVMPVVISGIVGARIRFNPILSATLALGLVASGYFAETFRAGIQAVPTGHVEAARALGMTTPGDPAQDCSAAGHPYHAAGADEPEYRVAQDHDARLRHRGAGHHVSGRHHRPAGDEAAAALYRHRVRVSFW